MKRLLTILLLSLSLAGRGQITGITGIEGIRGIGGSVTPTPEYPDTVSFQSVQPATIDQVSLTLSVKIGGELYIDWGNDSVDLISATGGDVTVTSQYTSNNTTYDVRIFGDCDSLTKFYIYEEATVGAIDLDEVAEKFYNLTYLYLRNILYASGTLPMPTELTYLSLSGSNINWTYTGALPTGLTFLVFSGSNINWTYTGALPTGLTFLVFSGSNINWTYTGALPTGVTYLYFSGSNINWTYTGALPTGVTYLGFLGSNINWTYTGALPTGLTFLYLSGSNINWTGLNIGNNGNITTCSLLNYRVAKMSSADMVTLLTQMTNRTGNLPATITINDYADYTSPPSEVTNAVDALKLAKSITTVILGE